MQYKQFKTELAFEEILASREIIQHLIIPATGSNVVPQIRDPDGEWLQDSSDIIDELELRFPQAPVIPATPRQKMTSYLIEFLADEWMLPWGFWERWHYSLASVQPNHEVFNALQWGRMYNPEGSGTERLSAARQIFKDYMRIDAPETAEMGPYAGLVQLGVTDDTIEAWTISMHNILGILETHFDQHLYILGDAPSLADFALLGPIYPHLYKDPVTGFMMKTEYPLVSEWVERTNGSQEAGYSSYQEPRYSLNNGELLPMAEGQWLADDAIPESILPLLEVFFDEMWPTLKATMKGLSDYMASDQCAAGAELPGKSFYSPKAFKTLQSSQGPLTIEFELNGAKGSRMASPYQVWMLQRINTANFEAVSSGHADAHLSDFLNQFSNGAELSTLNTLLEACRVEKRFEQLFAGN